MTGILGNIVFKRICLISVVLVCLSVVVQPVQALPESSSTGSPDTRKLTAVFDCASVTDVPASECETLVSFYNDMGGPSWFTSDGWLDYAEVCSWEGISCYYDDYELVYHVDTINLQDHNLTGAWVTDLTTLIGLHHIYLSVNNISGTLSSVISNLPTTMSQISLSSNSISGTVPASLAGFTNLNKFVVGNNTLSGDFATAIGNLPYGTLTYLSMDSNDFTGTIPPTLANFTVLTNLIISDDNLTGDLGTLMGYIPSSIESLNLSGNSFTGTIPASALSLTNMWNLDVTANNLTGDFADALNNLPTSLIQLSFQMNDFYGSIPASIANFTNLSTLKVLQNDRLVGDIPMEITSLALYTFDARYTFLCEPADPDYGTWTSGITYYYPPTICGHLDQDLVTVGFWSVPEDLDPGVPFTAVVQVRNIGGATSTPSEVYLTADGVPTYCPAELPDLHGSFGSLEPGYTEDVYISAPAQPAGVYDVYAIVDATCVVPEEEEFNNIFGPQQFTISAFLFEADHETGDLSQWSSFNDGGGFLYACTQAAINGTYGACVERGTNDNRKQLIDSTPTDETVFSARFNFDPNSLSMGLGEPVRIMQMKMGAERPAFLVLQRFASGYAIQLNVKEDDLSKTKTAWYTLSNAPHTIEVDWAAASTPTANDGFVELYIDNLMVESITGLDNNSFTILSYRMGFTSRLAGKSISGIFYIDDVATDTTGYIGLP